MVRSVCVSKTAFGEPDTCMFAVCRWLSTVSPFVTSQFPLTYTGILPFLSPKHPQLPLHQGHLRPYYSCALHHPARLTCVSRARYPPITAMSTRSIPLYVHTLPHTYGPPPRLPNPQGFATREVDQRMPFWQKDLQSRSVPNAVPGNQGMLLPGQNPPNTQTTPMADTTPRLRSGTGR